MVQPVTKGSHGMSQHPTSKNGQSVGANPTQPAAGFNPAQGMTWQQITQHANNMYNQMYNQQYAQYANNANHIAYGQLQQQIYQQAIPAKDWVFDGKAYSLTEFADLAFGDTPERTAFLLRYTKGEIE